MEFILLMVGAMIVMYVLMIIPQKKRMKAAEAIEPGSRVLLASGMIATLRAVGKHQAIIELAPGVEVTALRQVIVRAVTPAEEEFVFADDMDCEDETLLSDEISTDQSDFMPVSSDESFTSIPSQEESESLENLEDNSTDDSDQPKAGPSTI